MIGPFRLGNGAQCRLHRVPHTVEDAHHPAAATTAHHTGQQRPATTGRFACHAFLHVRVLGDHRLVFLELLPADVPWVVVAQQDVPRRHGFKMTAGLSRSTIHYFHAGTRVLCL